MHLQRPCVLPVYPVSQAHLFTSFQTPPPIFHIQTSRHKGPLPSSLVASPSIGDSVRSMLLVSLDTHCFQLHTQQGLVQTVGSFSELLQPQLVTAGYCEVRGYNFLRVNSSIPLDTAVIQVYSADYFQRTNNSRLISSKYHTDHI